MERIRKALDLARVERGQSESAPSFDWVTARENAVKPSSATSLSSIVYSRTKVFAPSSTHLESNRILTPDTAESATAAYRMLRTQVLQRMDAKGWRSLAIFSPGADDGKTTTAINLAISLANDRSHTVLLVDFDLKHPMLASRLGLEVECGVDDALLGLASLGECLYHPDGFDRLVILPARSGMVNSSEILAGPAGRELVAELRGRYPERVVVFDLPPVLAADDALSFAPLVECGLVVAAEGRTRRNDLVRAIELLAKTPLVGTVLNRASDAPTGSD
jgi:protein-tyrosine kinase